MQTSMPPKRIPRHTVFCLGKGNYKEFCGRHVAWEQLYMLLFPAVGYENYQVWQEKKLRLELFPILCSFLAVRTRRSESFLCDREGMEVMKQKKSRSAESSTSFGQGKLTFQLSRQDQLHVEEVTYQCNGYMNCHHSLFPHPTSEMLGSILPTAEESKKDALFSPATSSTPHLQSQNCLQVAWCRKTSSTNG